jgi:uncharacterized protein HemY
MGAGIAALHLGDYSMADRALCEASKRDAENSDVWLWLAYLAAKQHRRQEAATSIAWSLQHGTENHELLQRIGLEFEQLGWCDYLIEDLTTCRFYSRAHQRFHEDSEQTLWLTKDLPVNCFIPTCYTSLQY